MRNDPAIGHPTCALDLQRRIRETQRERVARSIVRRRKRSLLDRVLGREPGELSDAFDADAFREQGEDVWKSLRL